MKELLDLYFTWFKMGLFTYGGGYAMLPLIIKEVSEKKNWASEDEIMDYYALSQCTPGVLAVNIATFIGNKRKGIIGGIVATLGVITPSIIIITLIASLINNYSEIKIVKNALNGISVAVCVLMTKSIAKIGKSALKDVKSIAIMIIAFIAIYYFGLSSALIALGAGIIGVILYCVEKKKC